LIIEYVKSISFSIIVTTQWRHNRHCTIHGTVWVT